MADKGIDAYDHPLLEGVDRAVLERLLAAHPPKRVSAGDIVSLPGGPPLLHLVLSGLLRAYRLTSRGHQLLLELLPPGGFDGLVRMSGRAGHFTMAVEDSVLVSLPQASLRRALSEAPRLATNLLWASAQRLSIREQQMEAMAARGGVVGVAGLLVLLAERNGVPEGDLVRLPDKLTQQTMAEMLGVRRETVTTALRKLKAAGAVHKTVGRYMVNPAVLDELIGG